MRILGALLLLALASAFALDGCTYGLEPADPVSGRPRGCYTRVEHWASVKGESWIRPAEQLAAALALLGAVVTFARRTKR